MKAGLVAVLLVAGCSVQSTEPRTPKPEPYQESLQTRMMREQVEAPEDVEPTPTTAASAPPPAVDREEVLRQGCAKDRDKRTTDRAARAERDKKAAPVVDAMKWIRANCEQGFWYAVDKGRVVVDDDGHERVRDVEMHAPKWTCPATTPKEVVAAKPFKRDGGKYVLELSGSANSAPGQIARPVVDRVSRDARRDAECQKYDDEASEP